LLPDRGRILAIDIIRGFAIKRVVVYQLCPELRYPNGYARKS
jgi:peptidoglycan/LPS O-acetylase OafA/YrhL